jgi:Amt family ammonium transporter
VQLIAVVIVAVYSAVITFVLLKGINLVTPLRVSEKLEADGLDTEFQEAA